MGGRRAESDIRFLDLNDIEIVREILSIQKAAYRQEAELIGFSGIPALADTPQTIQDSGEIFYGYRIEGRVVGVVSVQGDDDTLDICRMVTHPDYHRRGVASQLLRFVVQREQVGRRIRVSTAVKNKPALSLYGKWGFTPASRCRSKEGVELITLEKRYSGNS
jgi:ribosomal protein S18 acetylase RimI-like enzyme